MKSITFVKRSLQLSALLIATSFSTFAQTTAKDVFNNSETQIIYLGIDFTKTKVIDFLTESEFDMRDKHFPGANEIIVGEEKKFDLKDAFHKSYIDHDLGPFLRATQKSMQKKSNLPTQPIFIAFNHQTYSLR